jgi:hypothetical protein
MTPWRCFVRDREQRIDDALAIILVAKASNFIRQKLVSKFRNGL